MGLIVKKTEFKFPVGYHDFHKDQVFNYQMNRWYSMGYARMEDMKEAATNIKILQIGKGKCSNRLKKQLQMTE